MLRPPLAARPRSMGQVHGSMAHKSNAGFRAGPGTLAVVTGANKGIGLETARLLARAGCTTVLTARDAGRGRAAVELLRREGLPGEIEFHPLDIADGGSVTEFSRWLREAHGPRLSVLINNAGMAYKGRTFGPTEARTTVETNVYGTMRVCDALAPLMPPGGRIVNVCSRAGLLSVLGEPACAQMASAASAEAAYTRVLARELEPWGVAVNACCPGYCATDMSSGRGDKTATEGADVAVWLALSPEAAGATGKFYAERREIGF